MRDIFGDEDNLGFFESSSQTPLTGALEVRASYQLATHDGSICRKTLRQYCPDKPGIYAMASADGEIIYVGKSKRLRTRLNAYFRAVDLSEKAARIRKSTQTFFWEVLPDEFGCLLRELELIRLWRPKFNFHLNPRHGKRVFLCLGRGAAPYFHTAKHPTVHSLESIGPLPGKARVRKAAAALNDFFQLRTCAVQQELIFAEQQPLLAEPLRPGCLRFEVKKCSGPCVRGCSRRDYAEQTIKARALFQGSSEAFLAAIKQKMADASANLAFEKAASLRDEILLLEELLQKVESLREVQRNYNFVYAVPASEGNSHWYVIKGGKVATIFSFTYLADIAGEAEKKIRAIFEKDERTADSHWPVEDLWPGYREDPQHHQFANETLIVVASWFRKSPVEWARILKPEEAIAQLREA